MYQTRRGFLRSTLVACGSSVPLFVARFAGALAAGDPDASKGRVLVILQLDGGNDGLNTIVPYRDDIYLKCRPTLRQTAQDVLKINDRIGFHRGLAGMAKLLDRQQVAIIQSVGYPNPNRSHFESMAIWHTAQMEPQPDVAGWLGKALDARPSRVSRDIPALHLYDGLTPQALAGGRQCVPSLHSLEQFRRRVGPADAKAERDQRLALDEVAAAPGSAGSLLDFVQSSTLITYTSSARLEAIMRDRSAPAVYPQNYGLAGRLKLIAQLIKSGMSTSIYYTQLPGFDTHAGQFNTHFQLLREVGDSMQAFLDDLGKSNEANRVLVLIFSEFGRRLHENGSAGTDHGTAAPVFLLGPRVKAGPHGPYPNLLDLADGDPKHGIDFRQVYATVLDKWLGCPSEKVLGGKFEHLQVI